MESVEGGRGNKWNVGGGKELEIMIKGIVGVF